MGFGESEHSLRANSIKEKMSLTFIVVYQALVVFASCSTGEHNNTAFTLHLFLE